jgi:hypothetical protein
MNKTLFITMTLSIIVAAVTCFLLLQFWGTHRTQKALEANRPKGLVGFGETEPTPVS